MNTMEATTELADLIARGAKVIEKAPNDIVEKCNDYLHRLTDDPQ